MVFVEQASGSHEDRRIEYAARMARERNLGNGLLGTVGSKVIWQSPTLPVVSKSVTDHLRLGSGCQFDNEIQRLLLVAEKILCDTYHIVVRFSVREMIFYDFPDGCIPINLDKDPVWDSAAWTKLNAIKDDDGTPDWKKKLITDADSQFTGSPPFEIYYGDTPTVIQSTDTKYRLSNHRRPAKLSSSKAWPSLSNGSCQHDDRIRVRYSCGFLDETEFRTINPLAHNNILAAASWWFNKPEVGGKFQVNPTEFSEMFNSLQWRV